MVPARLVPEHVHQKRPEIAVATLEIRLETNFSVVKEASFNGARGGDANAIAGGTEMAGDWSDNTDGAKSSGDSENLCWSRRSGIRERIQRINAGNLLKDLFSRHEG